MDKEIKNKKMQNVHSFLNELSKKHNENISNIIIGMIDNSMYVWKYDNGAHEVFKTLEIIELYKKIDKEKINLQSKVLIDALNISGQQLAKVLGQHYSTISLKLNGKYNFTKKDLQKILDYNKSKQLYINELKIVLD